MVWLVVLVSEAENLDVFIVSHHHSALLELKRLAEPFNPPLAEAYMLVAKLSPCLEEGGNGPAHHDLDIYGEVRLFLANCAC